MYDTHVAVITQLSVLRLAPVDLSVEFPKLVGHRASLSEPGGCGPFAIAVGRWAIMCRNYRGLGDIARCDM
jgi:hypothetical protein